MLLTVSFWPQSLPPGSPSQSKRLLFCLWRWVCVWKLSLVIRDHLQTIGRSRLFLPHAASDAPTFRLVRSGFNFREEEASSFFSFCRKSQQHHCGLFFFLTWSTAAAKEEGAAINNLTDSTVWGSCEQLFVCQPRNSQSEPVFCQEHAHTKD